jgi:ABC-type proline/glycine betaine transport system ATPase subunit
VNRTRDPWVARLTEALRPVAAAIQLMQTGVVVTTGQLDPAIHRPSEGRISPLPN